MQEMQGFLELFSILFCVLAIGALSGLFSERAGVVNIAINGMMIIGALSFSLIGKSLNEAMGNGSQILAFIFAGAITAIFSLLHAFACIHLKAQQVVVGTAINVLAAGIALFIVILQDGAKVETGYQQLMEIKSFPLINFIFILTVILLVGSWFVLNKTKWGLRHVAAGENPNALEAAGINVFRTRYVAVIISGFLAGIAGGMMVFRLSGMFSGNVQGYGFICLAILIFGQWRIEFIALAAILFATLNTFVARIILYNWVPDSFKTNSDVLRIVPFILSIITMIIFSKKSQAPKAVGIAFDKSLR